MSCASSPAEARGGIGLVGLAVEVPESDSSQASLSIGLGERDVSLLPLREVCLCCWPTDELYIIIGKMCSVLCICGLIPRSCSQIFNLGAWG